VKAVSVSRLPEEGGHDAAPFRAVETLVGVSDAAVSRRSKNKRDILAALALASFRDMNASVEKASQDWPSPFDALKHVIRVYSIFTKRFPARYRLMRSAEDIGQEGELASEVRRTVRTVARLVQTAQQAGQLKDGDPDKFAALIVGAMHGQADLDRSGTGLTAGKLPPLLLLELIAEKSGGRSARRFAHDFGSPRILG
jgi:AcrR family transcriptional regulator